MREQLVITPNSPHGLGGLPDNWREFPFQVYLAHAHEDFLLVERIWRALDHMGLHAYMYEHYPHPGKTACEAVMGAMQDAAEVVVFLTDAGSGSAWVHQELGAVTALQKPMLPVVQVNAIQPSGFAALSQPVLIDPRRTETAIGRLLWLLRVDFELFDGPLTVECPQCHGDYQTDLPSLNAVRRAMDANKLLDRDTCRNCSTSLYLSPWTLEPVSEQMALGRAWPE